MQTCVDLKEPIKRKITSGTKEWADYNVNCIKGCFNNCRYCYARVMARRFHRSTDDSWKDMSICEQMLTKKFVKKTGRAMFPSTHDLFDFEPYKEASFKVLNNLLKEKNDVLITTKPRTRVVKEIIERFSFYKNQIQFRFTITSNNDTLLSFWEPNAPGYQERFDSIRYAFLQEIKTSVSVEPFLDYNPLSLIGAIDPYVSESIWLGKMNYITRNGLSLYEDQFYNNIRKNYETPHLQEIYDALKTNPKIRFKDSIRYQLLVK
jgi:DNA repair photolyase